MLVPAFCQFSSSVPTQHIFQEPPSILSGWRYNYYVFVYRTILDDYSGVDGDKEVKAFPVLVVLVW